MALFISSKGELLSQKYNYLHQEKRVLLSEKKLQSYLTVSDLTVNELYQQARAKDKRLFVKEVKVHIPKTIRPKTFYRVFIYRDEIETMNAFTAYPICTRETVINYFNKFYSEDQTIKS